MPVDGDKVIVYNNADAEYTISGDGTEITIAGPVIQVSWGHTFANLHPYVYKQKYMLDRVLIHVSDDFDEVHHSVAFDRIATSGVIGYIA